MTRINKSEVMKRAWRLYEENSRKNMYIDYDADGNSVTTYKVVYRPEFSAMLKQAWAEAKAVVIQAAAVIKNADEIAKVEGQIFMLNMTDRFSSADWALMGELSRKLNVLKGVA
jgi:hypothetical protein